MDSKIEPKGIIITYVIKGKIAFRKRHLSPFIHLFFIDLNMKVKISIGNVHDCLQIANQIPEFSDKKYNIDDYHQRLDNSYHLILIAYDSNVPIGFKVGYNRDKNQSFYSWMGGVIPGYRQKGIAKALAKEQEWIVSKLGYKVISFKTRNYLKAMLIFAIRNGFNITAIEEKNEPNENRIILEKKLN